MAIQMLSAFLLAFLFVVVFGKWFVPWLEKKGLRQTVKDEVDARIYSKKDGSSSADNNRNRK